MIRAYLSNLSLVQATTHLAETTVLADIRALTIFSAKYVVHCTLWLKYKLTIWTCFGVIAERKGDLLETAVFAGSTSITNFADESFGKAQGAVVDVVGELGQNPIKKFDQRS